MLESTHWNSSATRTIKSKRKSRQPIVYNAVPTPDEFIQLFGTLTQTQTYMDRSTGTHTTWSGKFTMEMCATLPSRSTHRHTHTRLTAWNGFWVCLHLMTFNGIFRMWMPLFQRFLAVHEWITLLYPFQYELNDRYWKSIFKCACKWLSITLGHF